MSANLRRGYSICFIGTLAWSFTAIFIRHLNDAYQLEPLVVAFWRDGIVTLALGVVLAFGGLSQLRVERRHTGFLLVYGLVLSLFNATWTISVALNGAAVSTVLAYSSAAFTAVLGWRLFGEQLDGLKILAVSFSLIGCVFVAGAYDPVAWGSNPVGVLTGLISGLAFAAYSLIGKASVQRGIPTWTALFYAFGGAAIFLLLYNLPGGWLREIALSGSLVGLGSNWAGWGWLVALALGPTIGGYGLYTLSLNDLPASVANLIATLEPALTSTWAYLFFAEVLAPVQLFGSGLILAGIVVLRWRDRWNARHRGKKTILPVH